jgi:hypothetical protein
VDEVQKNNLCGFGATACAFLLEPLAITWNHVIEKEPLKFKELEHVKREKAGQLFHDMRKFLRLANALLGGRRCWKPKRA